MHRPRIVINTAGSLGDLHPYVAIALALRERGADPVLATHGMYRAKVETLGLGFHEVPPDLADFGDLAETMKIAMDRMKGSEYVVRKLVLPYLAPGYAALEAACRGADLLVTHPLSFAGRILAEKQRLPWVGTALQPVGHDVGARSLGAAVPAGDPSSQGPGAGRPQHAGSRSPSCRRARG